MKINDIVQLGGLPYAITEIKTDYDPYLYYCKHYKAKCFINGFETGGAITEYKNPYCNINAVLEGKLKSKYCSI